MAGPYDVAECKEKRNLLFEVSIGDLMTRNRISLWLAHLFNRGPIASGDDGPGADTATSGGVGVDVEHHDTDGSWDLSEDDRAELESVLAQPTSELIWSVRQSDFRSRYGLALMRRVYPRIRVEQPENVRLVDECRVALAEALAADGQADEALDLLHQSVSLRERHDGHFTVPLSLLLIRTAECEAASGRREIAITTMRRALDVQHSGHFFYGDRARAYRCLSVWLRDAGDEGEAAALDTLEAGWHELSRAAYSVMRDDPVGGFHMGTAALRALESVLPAGHPDVVCAAALVAGARFDLHG